MNHNNIPSRIANDPLSKALILYLYDHVIQYCQLAMKNAEENEMEQMEQNIGKAWAIIRKLKSSLDTSYSNFLAETLSQLYEFIETQLENATSKAHPDNLILIVNLLINLKSHWEIIKKDNKSLPKQDITY